MMKSLVNGMRTIYAHLIPSISTIHHCTPLQHQVNSRRTVHISNRTRHPTTTMLRTTLRTATLRPLQQTIRLSSTTSTSEASQSKAESTEQKKPQDQEKPAPKKKTMAELDEELRQKMSGLAGDGGEAGVELEGGQVRLIDHFELY